MKKIDFCDLYVKVPKSLMIAIANGVGKAQPSMLVVYLLIADRFSNTKGAVKVCYEDNSKIAKRSGLSLNCVNRAVRWLLKHSFIIANYPIKIGGPDGTIELSFSTSKAAYSAQNRYCETGVTVTLGTRKIMMPEFLPSPESLGLFLIDKNSGFYSIQPINFESLENNANLVSAKLNADLSKKDSIHHQNGGTKLDPLSHIDHNLDSLNEENLDEIEERITNNNPFFENPNTTEENTKIIEIGSKDGPPSLDPMLCLSFIALKTLFIDGFTGAAKRTLKKSQLSPFANKVTAAHFTYVFKRCRGDVPEWVSNLALEFEHEFEGIGSELQKFH